jgi:hypothetical protein
MVGADLGAAFLFFLFYIYIYIYILLRVTHAVILLVLTCHLMESVKCLTEFYYKD